MKTRYAFCASALALLAAMPAHAQNAPAAQNPAPAPSDSTADNSGGDIVVTAQFREQNLQDTPLAITAVNAEMLEARSQTNIAQVANQAPSVTLKPQGAAYGPSLGANIRGVGQFDFNPALEPGVGFYVDDVYYATLTGSITRPAARHSAPHVTNCRNASTSGSCRFAKWPTAITCAAMTTAPASWNQSP